MKLGIIGAMDSEVESLKAALKNSTVEQLSSMDFYSGELGRNSVVVVKCGPGKVNAAMCAEVLALRFGVEAVINTGVAGSLDPRMSIGDAVVATDAVEHDMDASEWGYELGLVPGMDTLAFPMDERLHKAALAAVDEVAPDISAWEGRVATGDLFVGSVEHKRRIIETFGAICCEMEGAAIAHACYLNKLPCLIVRMISDNADGEGQVDFSAFEAQAAARCAAIVRRLAETL